MKISSLFLLALALFGCSSANTTGDSTPTSKLIGSWQTEIRLSQLGYAQQKASFSKTGILEWTFSMYGGDKESTPKSVTHKGAYKIEGNNIITDSPNLPGELTYRFHDGQLILSQGKEEFLFKKI
jgi:hypothetical protein